MDDELTTGLEELGAVIQQMLLLAETQRDGPATMKLVGELRDQLRAILGQLKDSSCYILVVHAKRYPEAQRVWERELADLYFGIEYHVEIRAETILEGKSGHMEVRPGQITFRCAERNEDGDGEAEKLTPADLSALCEEGVNELLEKIGFGFLNAQTDTAGTLAELEPEYQTFSNPEHHVLTTALEEHWDDLMLECQKREYLVGSYDEWVQILTVARVITIGPREQFVLDFVTRKELEKIENLAPEDQMPNCQCTANLHRTVLLVWKERNGI